MPPRQMANSLFAGVFIGLIRAYQATLGPLFGGQCRFHPTCSAYGIEAMREWGPWRGAWMTLRRIARCHPFNRGGIDPVPPNGDDHVLK